MRCEKTIRLRKKIRPLRLHIARRVVEFPDPEFFAVSCICFVLEKSVMRRLLIVTTLALLTGASFGCRSLGECSLFGRRDACEEEGCPCETNQCPCQGGCGGAPYQSGMMSVPVTPVTPGPAYTGYLQKN
jgi:hypothetical protein